MAIPPRDSDAGRARELGNLGAPERLETIRTGPEDLPADVDVLWHLGTHDLSIAVEILGTVAPVRRGTRRQRFHRTDHAVPSDDGAASPGRSTGWTSQRAFPNGTGASVVSGTDASAELDRADAGTLSVRTRDDTKQVPVAQTMPLAEELRVFLAHLAGGPPPVSDAATALLIAQRLSELQTAGATRA